MSSKELLDYSVPYLKEMFPDFDQGNILNSYLWKAPYAQPIITKGYQNIMPKTQTPIKNLHFLTMAQVYPEDRGTNYAVFLGRKLAKEILLEMK